MSQTRPPVLRENENPGKISVPRSPDDLRQLLQKRRSGLLDKRHVVDPSLLECAIGKPLQQRTQFDERRYKPFVSAAACGCAFHAAQVLPDSAPQLARLLGCFNIAIDQHRRRFPL